MAEIKIANFTNVLPNRSLTDLERLFLQQNILIWIFGLILSSFDGGAKINISSDEKKLEFFLKS